MSALCETKSGSRAPAPGLIISRPLPRCNRREAVTAQPHPVRTPWRLAAGRSSPFKGQDPRTGDRVFSLSNVVRLVAEGATSARYVWGDV
jgi:hypothetical protein